MTSGQIACAVTDDVTIQSIDADPLADYLTATHF